MGIFSRLFKKKRPPEKKESIYPLGIDVGSVIEIKLTTLNVLGRASGSIVPSIPSLATVQSITEVSKGIFTMTMTHYSPDHNCKLKIAMLADENNDVEEVIFFMRILMRPLCQDDVDNIGQQAVTLTKADLERTGVSKDRIDAAFGDEEEIQFIRGIDPDNPAVIPGMEGSETDSAGNVRNFVFMSFWRQLNMGQEEIMNIRATSESSPGAGDAKLEIFVGRAANASAISVLD